MYWDKDIETIDRKSLQALQLKNCRERCGDLPKPVL